MDASSFAADNSVGVEDGLLGKPMFEIPREAIRLPAGTDIQAIDLFLPMIAANGGVSDVLFQNTTEFYFSLTSASATAMASVWNLAIDGATILKIVWLPGTTSSTGSWSAPQIVFHSSDLGLTATDDVDALAMATTQLGSFPGIPTIVSTVPSAAHPNRNQILALVGQGTPNPGSLARRRRPDHRGDQAHRHRQRHGTGGNGPGLRAQLEADRLAGRAVADQLPGLYPICSRA